MRVPRWALTLIAVAVLAWVAGAEYSFHLNPEIVFFRSGDRLKQGWLRRVRASHTNVTCICGGSSVATSIEGKRLLERHGLPVVNLGLGAGMGAKVLSRYALDPVETGDTLLICLEPDLLGGTIELEPLGVQFALTIGRPALLREGRFTDWPSALLCLRPGGYHVITLAGKLASGRPLYRYAAREFQPDGTHVVEARLDFPAGEPVNLTRMFHTCLGGTGDSPVPPGHWPGGMRKARQRLACTHSHTASFPFRPASRRTEQAGGLFHPFWSLACELSGLGVKFTKSSTDEWRVGDRFFYFRDAKVVCVDYAIGPVRLQTRD